MMFMNQVRRQCMQFKKITIWKVLYWLIGVQSWCLRRFYVRNFWLNQSQQPPIQKSSHNFRGLSILFYSPFPSHPTCHGSYARINVLREQLKEAGHQVHFALLESVAILPSIKESLFAVAEDSRWNAMRAAWDSVHFIPVKHLTFPFVSQVPLDGWYEDVMGLAIRNLCIRLKPDVVICSYVFQSKMLEGLPNAILKVIDTHDRMGERYDMLKQHGITNTFFSCAIEDERTYLERADVVLAIRDEEKQYFNALTSKKHAMTLSHIPAPRFLNYAARPLKKMGWVSSDIPINFSMLVKFVERLVALETKHGNVPFQLHIAGNIKHALARSFSRHIRTLFRRHWIVFHGFVPQIHDFYKSLDLVVAPVHCGTGINIKVVEALSFGVPLYATQCASKGISTQAEQHQFLDIQTLADALYFKPPSLEELIFLARLSRALYTNFYQDNRKHLKQLLSHPKLSAHHFYGGQSMEHHEI